MIGVIGTLVSTGAGLAAGFGAQKVVTKVIENLITVEESKKFLYAVGIVCISGVVANSVTKSVAKGIEETMEATNTLINKIKEEINKSKE